MQNLIKIFKATVAAEVKEKQREFSMRRTKIKVMYFGVSAK